MRHPTDPAADGCTYGNAASGDAYANGDA